jgi:hypothetical protein
MITKEELIDALLRKKEYSEKKLGSFRKEVQEHPHFALDGCDDAFVAAARMQVCSEVLDALTKPDSKATLGSIKEFAWDRMLSMALHGLSSTSQTSNLYRRSEEQAWAEVAEFFPIREEK